MSEQTETTMREAQRGMILRILILRDLDWVIFSELHVQLVRGQGQNITAETLGFHLKYLEGKGYAEMRRLKAGRARIELTAVRATPKAVDLLDGRIAEDPGVAF